MVRVHTIKSYFIVELADFEDIMVEYGIDMAGRRVVKHVTGMHAGKWCLNEYSTERYEEMQLQKVAGKSQKHAWFLAFQKFPLYVVPDEEVVALPGSNAGYVPSVYERP